MNGPDAPLAGRRAVVTGASSGIGLATVRRLLALGADVTGVARRAEAIEAGATAEPPAATAGWEPPAAGAGAERAAGHLRALPLDVSDARAVAAAGLGDARAARPAGLRGRHERPEPPARGARRRDLEHARGHEPRGLLPHGVGLPPGAPRGARARGPRRLGLGRWPDRSGPGYQAAKAGLLAFARGAGLDEQEHGVRFSVVAPGLVDTPLLDRRPEPPPPEDRERMLRPDDVAELITVLARLPERVHVPELTVLPSALQAVGRTW